MQRQDFFYDLPTELIAQTPLSERSASRLLVVEPGAASEGESFRDSSMRDFPKLLRAEDLLVFNDTRVVAARLIGRKPSGGRVEVFLERALPDRKALVQLRASKPIRVGLEIATAGGKVRVSDREGDLWLLEFPEDPLEFFERWGDVPLPPYIHRAPDAVDRQRYQSIFARERGAVAAPTASLHFDAGSMAAISAVGARHTFVTLHVGAGTFQPVRVDTLETHVMHSERAVVSEATLEAVANTRASGGRVIAVGTTVVRALESAVEAKQADPSRGGWSGDTSLFIRPGFRFRAIDALLTNFHLPESTLLMLVCAFAGQGRVLAAYRHAVQSRYRFFSYGDAMFLQHEAGVR